MKIVVCLKQVPATDSRIKPAADGKSADLSGVEWVVNPYDEYALEQALQLKEKFGGEVVVVSVGGDKLDDAIRTALALGADRAEVLKDPAIAAADALTVSRALAALVKRNQPDLVLCGKQAVDDDRMAVPAMVAELLDWPQATVVVGLEFTEDGTSARAEREIEGGHEEIEISLPAVIATQKGLNEPRYASLKGIMAAKKKPIETVTAADLGLDPPVSRVEILDVSPPPEKTGARMLEGDAAQQVAELVRILHEEEKLI
jgi:electron transfer flavoprotein beta subunit